MCTEGLNGALEFTWFWDGDDSRHFEILQEYQAWTLLAAFIILSFEGEQSRRSLVELAATAGLQEGFSGFFEQEAKRFI